MVQRFSELYRVDQGMAVDVCLVMTVQLRAAKMECGDLAAVGFKPNAAQVCAHAKIKCASEYVRGLKTASIQ